MEGCIARVIDREPDIDRQRAVGVGVDRDRLHADVIGPGRQDLERFQGRLGVDRTVGGRGCGLGADRAIRGLGDDRNRTDGGVIAAGTGGDDECGCGGEDDQT